MAWTSKQRQRAAMAAKEAGIIDEHRRLILLQFENRGIVNGEPSSKSPRLTNADFERFMAICEQHAGGKLKGFSRGRFGDQAEGEMRRQRHVALRIANTLELNNDGDGNPLLEPEGVGLRGWIRERVTSGRTDELEELTHRELQVLLNGLSAYARRHGLKDFKGNPIRA